jgi:uncharacterized membrane protein YeaQ/YmgE (transglycosylase-associated protein family)
MGIISTIICGAIIGVVAKFIMPGKNEPQGFILTAILGIVGAYVGALLPLGGDGGGIMWWVQSIVGALIVLLIYHMATRGNASA